MENELIKYKLSNPCLRTDPFLELKRCFNPCVFSMEKPGLNEAERTCASKVTSQLREQVPEGVRG